MSIMSKIGNVLQSKNGLRNILIFKFFAALVVLLVYRNDIFIGESPSSASEEATPAKALKSDKKSEPVQEKNSSATAVPAKTEPSAKVDGSGSDAPKRRSFIDDLLNLPKIDSTGMKKESLGKFLTLAEKKREQIDSRLEILKKKEEQLLKVERSIDDKLQKLDEERRFFSQGLQREKELKGKRIERLIELYAKMEPKKAAPIIEKLDKDLVVEILKQVDKKQAKSILESMDPQKSVELTEYYGRVRSAREYDLLKELNVSLRKEFADCKGMPQDQSDDDNKTGRSNSLGAKSEEGQSAPAAAPGTVRPTGANSPAANDAKASPETGAPNPGQASTSSPPSTEKPVNPSESKTGTENIPPKLADASKLSEKAQSNPEDKPKEDKKVEPQKSDTAGEQPKSQGQPPASSSK